MKKRFLVSGLICWSAMALPAQDANQVEKFSQQLKQIQENFEKAQKEMRESFEKVIKEQQEQIDVLKKQLVGGATNAPPGTPAVAGTAEQFRELNDKIAS